MKLDNFEVKRNLQNRLNRVEGQIRGISNMVGDERECREILQQLNAVRSALQSVTQSVLEKMVNDCLLEEQPDDMNKQEVASELINLIAKG